MIVETIYNRLKERDRKLSKSSFCKIYLNKSRNYWFVLNHTNTEISDNALINLYGNLKGMANTWRNIGNDDSLEGNAIYKDCERFSQELADMVMNEIERRALS